MKNTQCSVSTLSTTCDVELQKTVTENWLFIFLQMALSYPESKCKLPQRGRDKQARNTSVWVCCTFPSLEELLYEWQRNPKNAKCIIASFHPSTPLFTKSLFCLVLSIPICIYGYRTSENEGTKIFNNLITWGITPNAFLHCCTLMVFQETPSIWISPSVSSSLKNAKSKVLFPEPVLPKRPTCNANHTNKHLKLFMY